MFQCFQEIMPGYNIVVVLLKEIEAARGERETEKESHSLSNIRNKKNKKSVSTCDYYLGSSGVV